MSDQIKARVFSEAAELVSSHAAPAYTGIGGDYAAGYRRGIQDAVRARFCHHCRAAAIRR